MADRLDYNVIKKSIVDYSQSEPQLLKPSILQDKLRFLAGLGVAMVKVHPSWLCPCAFQLLQIFDSHWLCLELVHIRMDAKNVLTGPTWSMGFFPITILLQTIQNHP